jgi:hypothetical protein
MVYKRDKDIISKGKGKIMKLAAFCGKQNRDYAACIKNTENFLFA